jgi:hypothetical protein
MLVPMKPDVAARIAGLARRRRQSPASVVDGICRERLLRADRRSAEVAYARGYRRRPEDVGEIAAMVPYLALPQEEWS